MASQVKMITIVAPLLCLPIANCINFCICNNVFRESLKIAQVIALYKEGPLDDPSDYHPLSLLPIIGKVYEKGSLQLMTKFLGKHRLVSQNQFDFLKKFLC